ncbi:hypothetical protein [Massilia sp. BJB1822]|uniref:hypothetical protein n=1 Tax=Massilia sp. BJB1822 TaxID=2744470 RepID=UPI001593BEF2|nr:hypothetical protein [Massilia sp. BJB1822]NVE01030.1 hypothetical protein [Massilia sp. BJB1822]
MLKKITFIFALGLSMAYGAANATSACEQICHENFQSCSNAGQAGCWVKLRACIQRCP